MRLTIQFFFISFYFLSISFSAHAQDKISPDLMRYLDLGTQSSVPIVVMLRQVDVPATLMADPMNYGDIERLIRIRTLEEQGDIRSWVNTMAQSTTETGEMQLRRYKFFWTANMFMATVAPELISDLVDREDVQMVLLDRPIYLYREPREEVDIEAAEYTYGLQRIGVPEVRSLYPNLLGSGVSVGILDTGIDANHQEFKNRKIIFRDFLKNKTEAYDDNGHGTHVAGTIGGSGASGTQIGVAPEVNFVIGKIFDEDGGSTLSTILRGMEWISNPDGNPQTPDRPRVVNNSWGSGPSRTVEDDPFAQIILTWLDLEIFPSFAAGNSGPREGTVGSPGCLPITFAVGATDEDDITTDFSSRGPVVISINGKTETLTKPDISAPGLQIFSAMPGGKYARMSGTSMATPHITGLVALILQARPSLRVADIQELLVQSASDLGEKGKDNVSGFGRAYLPPILEKFEQQLMGYEDDWSI